MFLSEKLYYNSKKNWNDIFFWIVKKAEGQGNKGKLRIWAIYESMSWVGGPLGFLPIAVGGISILSLVAGIAFPLFL